MNSSRAADAAILDEISFDGSRATTVEETGRYESLVKPARSNATEGAAPFWRKLEFWYYDSIGLDLGTRNTVIYVEPKGIVLREPSVVALNGKMIATGVHAKEMIGKTPESIRAFYPLRDGVIADFDVCREMVKSFLKKVRPFSLNAPSVAVGTPAGVTEVERRAVREAILQAGAGRVQMVDECIAAAVGEGIDVSVPRGRFVVSMGGGTTQAAVVSLDQVVTSRVSLVAGNALDRAIMDFFLRHHKFLVGERTAEEIKIRIGSARAIENEPPDMIVRGRDEKGLPRSLSVTAREIRKAMEPEIKEIISTVRQALEAAPPELAADIVTEGVFLAGGTALLRGLPERIGEETGLPIRVAADPLTIVAVGAKRHADATGGVEKLA